MTMADTNTPKTGREHGGVSPILIVVGVAVIAFVIALVAVRGGGSNDSSGDVATGGPGASGQTGDPAAPASGSGSGSGSACGDGKPDSAYSVSMESDPNPPRAEGTQFHFTVRHDGKAVTGAKVCFTADMTEMRHEGLTDVAKEASGGKYDATLKFGMRGPYAGTVVVAESGKAAVSVPITFQVT